MKIKTKSQKPGFIPRIRFVLSHRYFFAGIVTFFALQMAWIALSHIYPMLFDEEYHLGIIDIYSRQISPFITAQPPEAAFHGDITRYSSYLFHYLMSFPYRVVSLFTADLMTKVIVLRFLCIVLVTVGLWLFRRVLLNFGVSRTVAHSVLLVFTLIPLVPFALAQINYDALVFLLVPLMLYLTQKASLKSSGQARHIILLLVTGSFGALTKFTVLPIWLGCLAYVGICLWRQYRGGILKTLVRQYKLTGRLKIIVVSLVLVLAGGLLIERFGLNVARYHALEPSCEELHTTEECLKNTVFRRNFTWQQRYQTEAYTLLNPLEYTVYYWVPHIFSDLFVTAALIYPDKNDMSLRSLPGAIEGSPGNIVLRVAGWVTLAAAFAVVFIAIARRRFRRQNIVVLSGLILVIYSASLWIKNYGDYLNIGTPVAAQGRYYIPLLILILCIVAMAFKEVIKNPKVYVSVLVISLLLLSQGGGVGNYMLYSNKSWYWPKNERAIETANLAARRVLRTFTPF